MSRLTNQLTVTIAGLRGPGLTSSDVAIIEGAADEATRASGFSLRSDAITFAPKLSTGEQTTVRESDTGTHAAVSGEVRLDGAAATVGELIPNEGRYTKQASGALWRTASSEQQLGVASAAEATAAAASIMGLFLAGFQGSGFVAGFLDRNRRIALGIKRNGAVVIGKYTDVANALDRIFTEISNFRGPVGYGGGRIVWGLADKTRQLAAYLDSKRGMVVDVPLAAKRSIQLTGALAAPKATSGDLLDRGYMDGRSRRKAICAWGDSTIQMYQAGQSVWDRLQIAHPDFVIHNFGVASQKPNDVLARMGLYPALFTLAAAIPVTGSVNLTPATTPSVLNGGTTYNQHFDVFLLGIEGRLYVPSGSGQCTFTRKDDGPPRTRPSGLAVPAVLKNVGWYRDCKTIISIGRNQLNQATITDALKAMVAALGHDDFVIMSIINAADEPSGSASYNNIIAINKQMQALWPRNYFDARKVLVDAYDPAQPADVTAYTNDYPPPSLISDFVHVNNAGAAALFAALDPILTAKGWFNA